MTRPNIHRAVLNDLSDGVLVVALGGRIETLNPAAELILGLASGEARGRVFAELFITREGLDDFTELVIYATSHQSGTERRVIDVRIAGEARSLSVATSHLRVARGEGAPEAVAVIAVFSDITELRELRETELRMARQAQTQHERLQDSYRQIEERNAALAAALRRVRIAQVAGVALVIALFLGAGLWSWRPLDLFDGPGVVEAEAAGPPPDPRTLTVAARPVSSSVTLKGRLGPWRKVAVRSPVNATIASVHFHVGESVAEGQGLVELDLSELERRYQRERVRYAKAREVFETLDRWETGQEMASARRNFTKAKLAMESERNKIRKSRFLFDQGLIAADEYDDAKRQHESQRLDFEAAGEELAAVRAQGGAAAVDAARLEMDTARTDMLALGADREGASIRAPVSGVVLAPRSAGKELLAGASVRKADVLLRIGDYSRMAALAQADEVDVGKLEAGQAVSITGNAFRGLEVEGVVSRVAPEADPKSRGVAKFDVLVTLEPLEAAQRSRVRSGMSGRLRIVTYSNPKALLVPIEAVRSRGGTHRLWVLDPKTGEAREREVAIGPTTRDSVEITAGLAPGEAVVLPRG